MRKKIQKILIANRGEITLRIIRTCRKMGIRTVAVYSSADASSTWPNEADEAVLLFGDTPARTYLNITAILNAAQRTGADAIHPGYGFLAENPEFAAKCREAGLIFIGPSTESIDRMGSKAIARKLAQEAGLPVIPGYEGEDQSLSLLENQAQKIGFPILIKAAAGGGGKGMRIVDSLENFAEALNSAKSEAKAAFGNDRMILEKYFPEVRHIEIQIFGDSHGNFVHLHERECSLQRRYQKVVEETPSPVLDESLRQKIAGSAVKLGNALNYENAGTVEFILTPEKEYYFLEVNTRLQVEHPVTEMVTGTDLVEWQIRVAEGCELPLAQDEIHPEGYAVEVRLYAEDPENNFAPVTGTIENWATPQIPGFRIESAVESGMEVSSFYDPMIAKLAVHGTNREEAFRKMEYGLSQLVCLGTATNREFLFRLMQAEWALSGDYHTRSLENPKFIHSLPPVPEQIRDEAFAAAVFFHWKNQDAERPLLKNIPSSWSNNPRGGTDITFSIGEERRSASYQPRYRGLDITIGPGKLLVKLIQDHPTSPILEIEGIRKQVSWGQNGFKYFIQLLGYSFSFEAPNRFPETERVVNPGDFTAPLPGQILRIEVREGQEINKGDAVLVISSMKMENTLYAEADGIISGINVSEGDQVEAGQLLITVETTNS